MKVEIDKLADQFDLDKAEREKYERLFEMQKAKFGESSPKSSVDGGSKGSSPSSGDVSLTASKVGSNDGSGGSKTGQVNSDTSPESGKQGSRDSGEKVVAGVQDAGVGSGTKSLEESKSSLISSSEEKPSSSSSGEKSKESEKSGKSKSSKGSKGSKVSEVSKGTKASKSSKNSLVSSKSSKPSVQSKLSKSSKTSQPSKPSSKPKSGDKSSSSFSISSSSPDSIKKPSPKPKQEAILSGNKRTKPPLNQTPTLTTTPAPVPDQIPKPTPKAGAADVEPPTVLPSHVVSDWQILEELFRRVVREEVDRSKMAIEASFKSEFARLHAKLNKFQGINGTPAKGTPKGKSKNVTPMKKNGGDSVKKVGKFEKNALKKIERQTQKNIKKK